jgi:hypothetical protein
MLPSANAHAGGWVARGATDFRKMPVSRTDVRDCIGEDERTPPAVSIGQAGPRRPRGATGSNRIDIESNRTGSREAIAVASVGRPEGPGRARASPASRGATQGSELWERSSRCACSHG